MTSENTPHLFTFELYGYQRFTTLHALEIFSYLLQAFLVYYRCSNSNYCSLWRILSQTEEEEIRSDHEINLNCDNNQKDIEDVEVSNTLSSEFSAEF